MSSTLIVSYTLTGLIIFSIIWYLIDAYNKFVFLKNQINKAFANISVLLKQRSNEIPALVDILSASSEHERSLLDELSALRIKLEQTSTSDQHVVNNNIISYLLGQAVGRSEDHPVLKNNALYSKVSSRIQTLEAKVADQRSFFNDTVTLYNDNLQTVPNRWFAFLLGFRPHPLLDQPQNVE